jgi:hypothetical protein
MNGELALPKPTEGMTFHLGATSAGYWQDWVARLGVLVCGRTLFDVTDGWGARHTMDAPVVVVTHGVPTAWVEADPEAPFHLVTEGFCGAVTARSTGPRTSACRTRSSVADGSGRPGRGPAR